MTARIIGSAISLAVILSGASAPALGQFAPNYPVIIVPPPAQNYAAPKPDSKTGGKPKPSTDEPEPSQAPAYHGQTRELNRY